ncbi:MAG: hydantoin utilization protein A [Roseivirga sp.]
MISVPLLFAAVIGFNHAFEADHVLAVGNIANSRKKFTVAIRDGFYWGLGHTSMILVIGLLIIMVRSLLTTFPFDFIEVLVGASLITLGGYRFFKKSHHEHNVVASTEQNHKMAYSMGLIHGLAGSGAVILLAMAELEHSYESMIYLLLFGCGSIVGMMIVAGVFNLPFSKKIKITKNIQILFVKLSAVICVGYGVYMMVNYFL